jgi:D-alanyl-D-alanine carboxypeptidase
MRVPRGLLLTASLVYGCGSSGDKTPAAPETQAEEIADAAAPPPAPNPLAVAADALFSTAFDDGTFAGSVVVVDGGEIVLQKAYGLADRKRELPNVVDTIYRVGSVSKQFTAAAVLALAEDGALDVSDPVAKYFPEYPEESLEKGGVKATLHHLLTHTSGLGDAQTTEYFKKNAWFELIDPATLLEAAAELPMVTTPGTSFAYSNWGYYLLALVVERVSGTSYEAFLRERFFAPLGMSDTGTLLPVEKAARAALGYDEKSGGKLTTMSDQPWFKDRDLSLVFGSGQIYSTVTDLARWDRALASGEALPAKGALLFQPALAKYGYGWVVEKKGDVEVAWHNGALAPLGFTALAVRVPSKDRFVAYLANLDVDLVQPALETKVIALAAR